MGQKLGISLRLWSYSASVVLTFAKKEDIGGQMRLVST